MRLFRTLLPFLACSTASLAWAEDIHVKSRVAAVTLYPHLAGITRRAELDLPEGRHWLILQDIPRSASLETLQIDLTGARQTALLFREEGIPPRNADNPEVKAAEHRVKEIEARIETLRDEAALARSEAEAAQAALGFLGQLGSNEGLAELGAEALRDITRMITEEAGTAGQTALKAQVKAREIEAGLEELEEALEAAEQALAAIAREDEERLHLAVQVEVAQAGAAELALSYLTEGGIHVEPSYEWHLTTGESPEVRLKRGFNLAQDTGENWQEVALTISTSQPGEQGEPSFLQAQKRWVGDPVPPAPKQRVLSLAAPSASFEEELAEPIVEPVVIEDAAGSSWGTDSSGAGVTYRFAQPVSIASGADVLKLEMDALSAKAEVIAVAVPRLDETAYRVARFTNSFGEDLLPGYDVPMFVDGKLVTLASFDGLAAGQETELGFGEIRGLRLARDVLRRNAGERGVISRSNQQEEQVEISVENLTGETWPVRMIDRVPYGEQEELEITWKASPDPSEEDLDKRRGILAWEFDLAPGAEKLIRLETTLNWPEDKILR